MTLGEIDYDRIRQEVQPEEQEYAVVEVDTYKPPGDPEAIGKLYEVDDPSEVVPPEVDGVFYLLFDRDGNGHRLEELVGEDGD